MIYLLAGTGRLSLTYCLSHYNIVENDKVSESSDVYQLVAIICLIENTHGVSLDRTNRAKQINIIIH